MRRALIPVEAFLARVRAEHIGALAPLFTPNGSARAWQSECSLGEFLDLPTFPGWFVGGEGGACIYRHRRGYTRIRLKRALQREDFRAKFLEKRSRLRQVTRRVDVLVLHCSVCRHIAIVDGHHRLTRLACGTGAALGRVRVVALSSAAWGRGSRMHKICRCLSR